MPSYIQLTTVDLPAVIEVMAVVSQTHLGEDDGQAIV
ncbi:MAG: hypothetical protein BWY79_00702 [Actinobacteria bacterium ADurb.Bin444]|nr:MAG: hypothetical protein BWY79_00702 [Actinobacteria bacterium ADurb.Bin444]